jgi:streptomycin 6-kinase
MLLEHELWLRAARDPDVAAILQARNREGQRRSERELAWWATEVGSNPVAAPDQLAVLVKALLHGLAMQQRVDPGSVTDETAVAGLAALLGLDNPSSRHPADTGLSTMTTNASTSTSPTRPEHTS